MGNCQSVTVLFATGDTSTMVGKPGEDGVVVCFGAEEVIRSLGMAAEALQSKGVPTFCLLHVISFLD